jgi:hypothetical protein
MSAEVVVFWNVRSFNLVDGYQHLKETAASISRVEYGDSMTFRNVDLYLRKYATSDSRRPLSHLYENLKSYSMFIYDIISSIFMREPG